MIENILTGPTGWTEYKPHPNSHSPTNQHPIIKKSYERHVYKDLEKYLFTQMILWTTPSCIYSKKGI